MFLKQIDIAGFKSFANKTTLVFVAPKEGRQTITGIVGPNGSGKSNISDAMRWVMGEQSMKLLRGKKSEDVIFSGSTVKGKLGVASVFLTVDNSDGRVDIPYEEMVIGRRLYRSGESEYLLNNQPARLLDIQLILAKAQFGHGSYAVIGQGMIDKMLLQSAQDRKDFFDEASGIKEFQIKRHHASLRLARTEEHMAQAELVLQEISPRLKTLSRQVKKLEERRDVELRLRELQERYYTTLWEKNKEEAMMLQKKIADVDARLNVSQTELQKLQTELAGLAHEQSRESQYRELNEAYQKVLQEKQAKERERVRLQAQLHTEYVKVGDHQIGWLEQKIDELKAAQTALEKELVDEETSRTRLSVELSEMENKKQTAQFAADKLRNDIRTLELQVEQVKHEQRFFHATGIRAVQAILEARQRLGEVFGAVAQLGVVEQKFQLALDVAAGANTSSLVVANEDVANACIEYLRREQLGVATFLPLTTIKPRYLRESIDDLMQMSGVHGLAIDLIQYDKRFEIIFSFLFGTTLIVDDASVAKAVGIGRIRMVTLEGDLFETTGSIKGGYRKQNGQSLSFSQGQAPHLLSQRMREETLARLEQTRKELMREEAELSRLGETVQGMQGEIRVREHTASLSRERKRALDTELAGLQQEHARATMSPEAYGVVLENIAKDKTALDNEMAVIEQKEKDAQTRIDAFHREEEEKKQRVFSLQDEMQKKQSMCNTLIEEKNLYAIESAKCETKQEDIRHDVATEMHVSIDAIILRGIPELSQEEFETAEVQVQKLKYTLSLIGGIDEEIVKEYEETKTRHEGIMGQLTDLRAAVKDLTTLIVELDELMKKKRDKAFKQIRKEFQRYFEVLFDGGKADLVEQYGVPFDVAQGEDAMERANDESSSEENGSFDPAQDKQGKDENVLLGIDIIASPPGKKITNIQALSGGERTLVSIALMCAILKINPPPFVALDEVEAALDEANSLRVANILKELSEQTQFIVITHNKVTMHAADALYGVTMGNDGVSHLVSIALDEVKEG